MLIHEYLQMRNIAGRTVGNSSQVQQPSANPKAGEAQSKNAFAQALQKQFDRQTANEKTTPEGVTFSRHALDRLDQRGIDMDQDNKLDRLNRAVEAAEAKGANETLVLLDQTAFVVSVPNRKVITTMTAEDINGNVFTNIDSTVIM